MQVCKHGWHFGASHVEGSGPTEMGREVLHTRRLEVLGLGGQRLLGPGSVGQEAPTRCPGTHTVPWVQAFHGDAELSPHSLWDRGAHEQGLSLPIGVCSMESF